MFRKKARSYFHVVVKLKASPKKRVFLFGDLTKKELRTKFIKPYERGGRILVGTDVFDVSDFISITITETNRPKAEMLEELRHTSNAAIDRMNQSNNGFFILSMGAGHNDRDIALTGTDVTARFVNGPPGNTGMIARLVTHPVGSAVVGGIILLAIGAALGIG